jgi:hypothetical protein
VAAVRKLVASPVGLGRGVQVGDFGADPIVPGRWVDHRFGPFPVGRAAPSRLRQLNGSIVTPAKFNG